MFSAPRHNLPPSTPLRIAARKCRAKKNALMTDLQATLAGLMRKNEEYKLQVCVSGCVWGGDGGSQTLGG